MHDWNKLMLHHYKRAIVKIIRLVDWKGEGNFSLSFADRLWGQAVYLSFDIDDSFSRLKWPAYTSLPPIVEVKHMWSYASNLPNLRA